MNFQGLTEFSLGRGLGRQQESSKVKYTLALVLFSALPVVACGGGSDEQQSAANNQLEAADNVLWNDLADISLENPRPGLWVLLRLHSPLSNLPLVFLKCSRSPPCT